MSTQPLTTVDPALYGDTSNGSSASPSISADGDIIVFQSNGTNLLPDVDVPKQIYAYNRTTDSLTLVTANLANGGPSQLGGHSPSISADGRFVLFISTSKDLVSQSLGSDLNLDQLYVRDLDAGTTTLVSASVSGTSGGNIDSGGDSSSAARPALYAISDNGRYVAFWSQATNLVSPAPSNFNQLYVRDLQTSTTRLASTNSVGAPAGASDVFSNPFSSLDVDNDGAILFVTAIDGLVTGDSNGKSDVFINDGTTHLVSVANGLTTPGDNDSTAAYWTSDQSRVFFISKASNLIASGANGKAQIYVRNVGDNTTTLVTHAVGTPGIASNDDAIGFTISNDGQYLALESEASNLVASDGNFANDAFLIDTGSGTATMISRTPGGAAAAGNSGMPVVSGDGSHVVFKSASSNLISGFQQNGFGSDYFVYDRASGTNHLISADMSDPLKGTDVKDAYSDPFRAVISQNGSVVAFINSATNLVEHDQNSAADLFVSDADGLALVSARASSVPPQYLVGGLTMGTSADGRYVLLAYTGADLTLANNSSLYIRDTVNGELTAVNPGSTASVFGARITPDGRYVVFSDGVVRLFDRTNGQLEVISKTPGGTSSSGTFNSDVDVSNDGRYVAFVGGASDLISGFTDANGPNLSDVYLRDRQTGTTVLVNRQMGTTTTTANRAYGEHLQISGNGATVVFDSTASDIVANDTNGTTGLDAFAFDVATSAVSLISVTVSGTAAGSREFTVTADGTKVAFASSGSNLVTGVGGQHVYVRNLTTQTTQLVDFNSTNSDAANGSARSPLITPDGQFVLFRSQGTDLVSGFTSLNALGDLYVRNLTTNQTTLISVATDGHSGANAQTRLDELSGKSITQISPNGRYVVFESAATNLVEDFVDGNGATTADLYQRDLLTGTTYLVSVGRNGAGGNGRTTSNALRFPAAFTALDDGRVVFYSYASNLTSASDGDLTYDTFIASPGAISGGTISGTVFNDVDANGLRGNDEPALAGVTLYLDTDLNGVRGPTEPTVTSLVNGNYTFVGLTIGTYRVRIDTTATDQIVSPASGFHDVPIVTETDVVEDRDFADHVLRPDLVPSNITFPAIVQLGAAVTFQWTVTNQGDGPLNNSKWFDAVYLSEDNVLDAGDLLVGSTLQTVNLAANASYVGSLTVPLPAVPYSSYYVIVQTDRRLQVQEINEGNNVAKSASTLQADVTALELNVPFTGTFATVLPGQPANIQYFVAYIRETGPSAIIRLDSAANSGTSRVVALFDSPPTQFNYDAQAANGTTDQILTLPKKGLVYIAVSGNIPANADHSFTLTVETTDLAINSIDRSSADRGGPVTLLLTGYRFDGAMSVSLVDAQGTAYVATPVTLVDASQMYATFDLPSIPTGNYSVRVDAQYEEIDVIQIEGEDHYRYRRITTDATLANAFTVTAAQADDVRLTLSAPDAARVFAPINAIVTVQNFSQHDVPAPILIVDVDNPTFLVGVTGVIPSFGVLQFQALGQSANPGFLRPGEQIQIPVQIIPPRTDPQGNLRLSVGLARDDEAAINWNPYLVELGADFTDSQWITAASDFVNRFGTTWHEVETRLALDAAVDGDVGPVAQSIEGRFSSYLAHAYFNAVNPPPSPPPVAPANLAPPPGPVHSIFESISPTLHDTNTLETKESFLRDIIANWLMAIRGNGIAQSHLLNFLGPVGLNSGYQPNSPFYADASKVSDDAASYNLGTYSFPPLHDGPNALLALASPPHNNYPDILKEEIAKAIKENGGEIPDLYQQLTKISNALYLMFYPTDTPNLLNLFNPTAILQPIKSPKSTMAHVFVGGGDKSLFDLMFGFGEMDNPHDAEKYFKIQLHFDPDKFHVSADEKTVTYEAELTYQFDDYYDWTVSHVKPVFDNKLNLARSELDPGMYTGIWAFDLRGAGLATPFSDSIQIKRTISGTVSIDKKPPKPEPEKKHKDIEIFFSGDPNEMTGPSGYGPQLFRNEATDPYPYTIHFENDPEIANAPAQTVVVTQQLDADLDWSTFQFTSIGFGDQLLTLPLGAQAFQTRIEYHNQDDTDLFVDVTGALDTETGLVTWTFTSIDPETGTLPAGVLDGFLPVEDGTGRGDGLVSYSIKPKAGLPTGTTIGAQASIVFDTNDAIATNVYTNTIDAGVPTSSVSTLPEETLTSTFNVSWSGTDDVGGSGVATYDVYVSDNMGSFVLWQTATALTSAMYAGIDGHSYAFYSVATDNVGHIQPNLGVAQATTVVHANAAPVISGNDNVTYIKKQTAIVVAPNIAVTDNEENLAGGTLTVSITDYSIGKKQVRPDQLSVGSLSAVGTVSVPQFVNGKVQVTVLLKANVTAAQVQAALRTVTFVTSTKGVKNPTRTLTVQMTDGLGAASNTYSRQIQLLKKAPKSRSAKSER